MHFKPKHVSNRAYNTECQLSPHVSCCSVTLYPCKSALVNNPADNVMQSCECTDCGGHIWHRKKSEIWAEQLCCEHKVKQKSHSSISQTSTSIIQPPNLFFSVSCSPKSISPWQKVKQWPDREQCSLNAEISVSIFALWAYGFTSSTWWWYLF